MNILSLSTAWGSKHGGINAFSADLTPGLAEELGGHGKVFCTAVDPTEPEIAAANKMGVIIIPLLGKRACGLNFDTSWIYEAREWLRKHHPETSISYCMGHDLISGDAALFASDLLGSEAALIHHMSYFEYEAIKKGDIGAAYRKHQLQRALFQGQASLFAVGPLLRDSCKELARRHAKMLIPGFPRNLVLSLSSDDTITALAFGRMDRALDRIKQGRLAVASFARAISEGIGSRPSSIDPKMYFIGVESAEETRNIEQFADDYAGKQIVQLFASPYEIDRDILFNHVADCNLAMMLSWHEGFGLTGWEAVAAEIPLIISEKSGLYQLIDETLGGAGIGCIRSVRIKGKRSQGDEINFSEEDLDNVKTHIVNMSKDIVRYKRDAKILRKMLIENLNCDWRSTAREFLDGLMGAAINPVTRTTRMSIAAPSPVRVLSSRNSIPECAELNAGITQGSTSTSFDLLPEVRFGREEFVVDTTTISYGIEEATLRLVALEDSHVAPGKRLGDDPHPNIESRGNNSWIIIGPKEGGVLRRRAVGQEPICTIHADDHLAKPNVSLQLSCRNRHVNYEFVESDDKQISPTKARIIEAFCNKCLNENSGGGGRNGVIVLSQAVIGVGQDKK